LQNVTIGWKVASSTVLSASIDAGALGSVTSLSINSILPEYAATLEQALARMSALTSFSIAQKERPGSIAQPIPVQVLMGLVRERSAVTSLGLSGPLSGDRDNVLARVFRSIPSLASFSWFGCGAAVADLTLLLLAEHCKDIRDIALTLSPTVTGVALASLPRGCRKLQNLSITGDIETTDAMLLLLAENCPALLQCLDLRKSVHITGPGVLHLLRSCPHLSIVRIPMTVGSGEEVAEMVRIVQARGGSGVHDRNPIGV
jgi:hypothetical protein